MKKYGFAIFITISLFAPKLILSQEIIHKLPVEFSNDLKNENIQLIDVRTAEEFSEGHLPNALNIDYLNASFKDEIKTLDKERPVYVYCKSGGRSAKAAAILKEHGFVKVVNLQGGYSEWTNAGLPTMK